MERKDITHICETQALAEAAARFGTRPEALKKFEDYEGAANLVYEYAGGTQPLILRITFVPERTVEQIRAELHFIRHLGDRGVRLSRPVPSLAGNWVETIPAAGILFHAVSFIKGRGMRMPDNDYRYRPGVPLVEYFHNWGRVLGQMHALTKEYRPESAAETRPEWFELHRPRLAAVDRLPPRLGRLAGAIRAHIEALRALPRDGDSFGLIHGDFNDGNFTVDYDNGDITAFDFDDCCYFWFIYELATAWESGVGCVLSAGLEKRREFMGRYFDQVMEGYAQENTLPAAWMERLPLFLRLVQIEEYLHFSRYLDNADERMQGRLAYKQRCIEEGIPYLGFLDPLYDPQKPFSL